MAEEQPAEVAAEIMKLIREVHDRRTELGLLGKGKKGSRSEAAAGSSFKGDRSVAENDLIDDPDDFATF